MNYHLIIDGVAKGPFSLEHIQSEFSAGRLDSESLCWLEGWPDWKSLGSVFPDWASSKAAPKTPARANTATNWIKLAVVVVAGLITSLAISAAMAFGEILTGYSIYGWLLWAVIPVGAIFAGMAGAGGSYYVALWTNYYPRFLFFIATVALGAFTLLSTQFLIWTNTQIDGKPLQGIITFIDYLKVISHDVSLVGKSGKDGIALGEFSIWYYVLQIAGFSAGGMMIFVFLRERPYCAPCSKYRKSQGVAELHELNPDTFENRIRLVVNLLQNRNYQEALAAHPAKQSLEKRGFERGFRSSIAVFNCPKCGSKTHKHTAYKCTRKDEWSEISEIAKDYSEAK